MNEIKIDVYGLRITAVLIHEKDPRLAICQDRVVLLDNMDRVISSKDLLDIFK